jgi:hypothetical protein
MEVQQLDHIHFHSQQHLMEQQAQTLRDRLLQLPASAQLMAHQYDMVMSRSEVLHLII